MRPAEKASKEGRPPQGRRGAGAISDLAELFNLLSPFFGLIAIGYVCGKVVRQPEAGLGWMQFFLIYISLPCLFFRLIADKPLEQLTNWPYVGATTLCTACAFALSLAVGLWESRGDLPQAVMQGVAGSYSNIGYMGPPLILSALGAEASAPVVLIFVFDSLFLFSLVPLLMAFGGAEKRGAFQAVGEVVVKVATHPFNLATALGVAGSLMQVRLPDAGNQMVTWLSNAAAPCALFLLGVTVALRPLGPVPGEVPALVAIKLVIHPVLVWLILSALGDFEPTWTYAAIIMAALPPALNIFVLSTQYGTGVERASACVLLGTLGSTVTLTAFLWLIRTGRMPADLAPPL